MAGVQCHYKCEQHGLGMGAVSEDRLQCQSIMVVCALNTCPAPHSQAHLAWGTAWVRGCVGAQPWAVLQPLAWVRALAQATMGGRHLHLGPLPCRSGQRPRSVWHCRRFEHLGWGAGTGEGGKGIVGEAAVHKSPKVPKVPERTGRSGT